MKKKTKVQLIALGSIISAIGVAIKLIRNPKVKRLPKPADDMQSCD